MLGIRTGYAWDKVGIRSANVEIRTTLGRNKATKWSRDKVTKLSRLKTNYRISQVLIRGPPQMRTPSKSERIINCTFSVLFFIPAYSERYFQGC